MFKRPIAFTLCLMLATPTLSVAPAAQSASCADATDQLYRIGKRYEVSAQEMAVEQLRVDASNLALNTLKEHLKATSPTAKAVFEVKEAWAKFKGYMQEVRAFENWLTRLNDCIQAGGNRCNSTTFRDETKNEEDRRFLDTTVEMGMQAASSRVAKVLEFTRNYSNDLFGGMASSVGTCVSDLERRAQAAQDLNPTAPVDPNTGSPAPGTAIGGTPDVPEPPSKPVDATSGGGGGGGDALLWGLIAAAGVAAGVSRLASADGGGGGKCTRPTSNPLTICANQSGASAACQSAVSEWNNYCRQCEGSSGFSTQRGTCQ